MKFRFIVTILLFLISKKSFCQNDSLQISSKWIAGINYGGIWGHNPPVYHLAQSHTTQIYAEYQMINHKKDWSETYKNSQFGIMIKYLNYNSKVLGSSFCAILFIEPKINKCLSYRAGIGPVYNTNPWNLENNQTNLMLGSNFAMSMHAQINLTIKKRIRIGFGLTHFSNGSYTQPNSGINTFYVSSGYIFRKKEVFKPESIFLKSINQSKNKTLRGISFSTSTSASLVENFGVAGKKYGVYQLQGRIQYRLGRKSSLLLGMDWKKNLAVTNEIKQKPELGPTAEVIGLAIGHELHISQVSLISELGIYLNKKNLIYPALYQRYGVRYYWIKGFYSALYLSTHKVKAECLEWCLGYNFRKKD